MIECPFANRSPSPELERSYKTEHAFIYITVYRRHASWYESTITFFRTSTIDTACVFNHPISTGRFIDNNTDDHHHHHSHRQQARIFPVITYRSRIIFVSLWSSALLFIIITTTISIIVPAAY